MQRFGFNINFRNTPEDILTLGEQVLGTGEYHAIEVTYYEDMEGVDVHAYNEAIRKIVAAYHPQVVVHISAFNLSEENSVLRSAILHEFRNCCKYTTELGGREIVMHSGRTNYSLHVPLVPHCSAWAESEFARTWDLSVQLFRTCCDIAKEYGITIHTENLNPSSLTVHCDQVVKFVEDIDRDNVDIVFDIGHCHCNDGDIPAEVLTCGSRLHHLHLHDNMTDGASHLPIGEGSIDYRSFCEALRQVGYDGLYMMELRYCTPENLLRSKERLLACM